MIVRVQRPVPPVGPWLLHDRTLTVVESFYPTRQLAAMVEGEDAYFEAELLPGAVEIKGRVEPQRWI